MATLYKHGEEIARLQATRTYTDGADADAMTCCERYVYSLRDTGETLKRADVLADYGTGATARWQTGSWHVYKEHIKPALLHDRSAFGAAIDLWRVRLVKNGWTVEVTTANH